MKELINVDGWVSPHTQYAGKYRDKQGQLLSGFSGLTTKRLVICWYLIMEIV